MKQVITPKNIVTMLFSPIVLVFGGIVGFFRGGKILSTYKGVFGKATAYFCSTLLLMTPWVIISPIMLITSIAAGKTESIGTYLIMMLMFIGLMLLGIFWFSKINRKCPKHLRAKLLTSMLMVAGGIGISISLMIFIITIPLITKLWVIEDSRNVYNGYSSKGTSVRVFEGPSGCFIEDPDGNLIAAHKTGNGFVSVDGKINITTY